MPASSRRDSQLRRLRKSAAWNLLALVAALSAAAAPPPLDHLFPAGGRLGSEVALVTGGKFDPWPVQAWCDDPALQFLPKDDPGHWTVTIASNAIPGPHWVHLRNDDGVSAPRLFVVGALPEILEMEPNDGFENAQSVDALPVTINGRLQKRGDADLFAVTLRQGTELVASVDAYRLDSPLDPVLHVRDERGRALDYVHDGRALDSRLAFAVPADGRYLVELAAFAHPPQANVLFAGEDDGVYRLFLTDGPSPSHAFPAGVQRGRAATVRVFGSNLDTAADSHPMRVDAPEVSGQTLLRREVAGSGQFIELAVGDWPEIVECDATEATPEAAVMAVPGVFNGRLKAPGESDRIPFAARSNVTYRLRAVSDALGLDVDPVLRLEAADGETLAENDDADGSSDADLTWKAPKDGTYVAVISDRFGRAEARSIYRLQIEEEKPEMTLWTEAPSLSIEPGATGAVKMNVKRRGDDGSSWTLFAADLPEAMSSRAVTVPEKSGKFELVLEAAAEAKPGHHAIRVVASNADPNRPAVTPASIRIKGRHAEAGELMLNATDRLWVTIRAKKAPDPKPEKDSATSP